MAQLAILLKARRTVDEAAHHAATSDLNLLRKPTPAQASAGNYRKGRTRVGGLDVVIENAAGTLRRPEWPPMAAHYGYAARSAGADGDAVDCFVQPGTGADWAGTVYVIDQTDGRGGFDEHKCMVGYATQAEAVAAYLAHYPPDWQLGAVTPMAMPAFRAWLRDGDTTEPVAALLRYAGRGTAARFYARQVAARLAKYSEDQPRDEAGRFGEGGGGAPQRESRGPAASRVWADEGKTPGMLLQERTAGVARELANQLAENVDDEDFAPGEGREAVRLWAADANVPADDLRQAVLSHVDSLAIRASQKAKIRRSLSPFSKAARVPLRGLMKYSDDQERDDNGRFAGGTTAAGDEHGARAPQPGERFVVYRLGDKGADLTNRNAGNANAVALHAARMQGDEGPRGRAGSGTVVTAHEVTIGAPFGAYAAFTGGVGPGGRAVGRSVIRGNEVAYSFPRGAEYTSRHIGTATLRQLHGALRTAGMGANFDEAGSNAGAEAIRGFFTRARLGKLLKVYDPDQARDDNGRWEGAGGDVGPAPTEVAVGLGEQAGASALPTNAMAALNAEHLTRLGPEAANKLTAMYREAGDQKQGFDRAMTETANSVGGKAILPGLKGSDRATEKIVDDYNGDASRIKDLLRGTIEVSTPAEAQAALASVQAGFSVERGGFRNLLTDDADPIDGYRDIKLNVRVGGIVAEVQVNVPAMLEVKAQYHVEYEARRKIEGRMLAERRDATPQEQQEIDRLNATMKAAYSPVWARISGRGG